MILALNDSNVFQTHQKHIAFLINNMSIGNSKFIKQICNYASGFDKVSKKEYDCGDIVSIATGNTRYHGIIFKPVIKDEWNNIFTILTESLNRIQTSEDDIIAVCFFDNDYVPQIKDVEISKIIRAIYLSYKKCVVFTYPYDETTISMIIKEF